MGRPAKKKVTEDPEAIAKIKEDLARWRPGLWAEENAYGATCICGAGTRTLMAARALSTIGQPTGFCQRHPGGTVERREDR